MTKYFRDVHTLEELKQQYKKLAKQYHPDLNGGTTVEIMQRINSEYDELFEKVKNIRSAADGTIYEKATAETSEMFRDIIDQIINFNVDIEIIGTWVWCFNSYEYRAQLKALGFRYAGQKKAWCWHSDEYRPRRSKKTMDEIRDTYGCDRIKSRKEQEKIA